MNEFKHNKGGVEDAGEEKVKTRPGGRSEKDIPLTIRTQGEAGLCNCVIETRESWNGGFDYTPDLKICDTFEQSPIAVGVSVCHNCRHPLRCHKSKIARKDNFPIRTLFEEYVEEHLRNPFWRFIDG